MQTFLQKTAGYLLEHYAGNLGEICVVLPNRRAGLFLRKNLSNLIDTPVWSPDILSIEDFVFKVTGFSQIEQVYLLFDLFEIYRETEKDKGTTFEEFLGWGEVVLNDFNDIDLYLADPDQLFRHLTDARAISMWNPDGTGLTPFQLNYLRFFNSLSGLYKVLTERLIQSGQVYQGLAYRSLSTALERSRVGMPWEQIVFAGFNALTPAEEKIINELKKSGLADLLWDADHYYIDHKEQEAGLFLRKIFKHQPGEPVKWLEDRLMNTGSTIHIVGVPGKTGQVKAAGNILREWQIKGHISDSTAVVLNDQSLLFPMLNSLPEELTDFNVTMGLPLKSTSMYKLLTAILTLYTNRTKFAASIQGNSGFYFSDVIRILAHPYMRMIFNPGDNHQQTDPVKSIRSSNRVFLRANDVLGLLPSVDAHVTVLMKDLFSESEKETRELTRLFQSLLVLLKDTFVSEKTTSETADFDLDIEFVYNFSKVINKLDEISQAIDFVSGPRTFTYLLDTIVQSVAVPFYGEPLRGVQVMGMLETRTLDFENIIMLSVNEDFIPAGKSRDSFIPFEIRKIYDLPVIHDRNAVYAYHFYRLLQRSSDVYLLYNTETSGLGGGEKSRFIEQIKHELVSRNPNIKIEEKIVAPFIQQTPPDTGIVIEKEQEVMDRLAALAEYGFSASSLNIYRSCSLRFYFQYVLGISEVEEVEETVEAATLGSVVHEVLHRLYQPLGKQVLKAAHIPEMKKKVPDLIREAFVRNYSGGSVDYGKNLLILKVAELFVSNFLTNEQLHIENLARKGIDLTIKETENEVNTRFAFDEGKSALLRGFIDRVDSEGDMLRIIDYKTGRVEKPELKPGSYTVFTEGSEFDKCFQLIFYAYVYQQKFSLQGDFKTGIISFRNLSSGFLDVEFPATDEKSWPGGFEEVLEQLLSEIFDPAKPFSRTPDTNNCKYCPFTGVCNR